MQRCQLENLETACNTRPHVSPMLAVDARIGDTRPASFLIVTFSPLFSLFSFSFFDGFDGLSRDTPSDDYTRACMHSFVLSVALLQSMISWPRIAEQAIRKQHIGASLISPCSPLTQSCLPIATLLSTVAVCICGLSHVLVFEKPIRRINSSLSTACPRKQTRHTEATNCRSTFLPSFPLFPRTRCPCSAVFFHVGYRAANHSSAIVLRPLPPFEGFWRSDARRGSHH